MSEEKEQYAIIESKNAYLATDIVNERSLAITAQLERVTPKQRKLLFCLENGLPFSMVWSNSIYEVNNGGISLDGKIIAARLRKSDKYEYEVRDWTNESCTVIIYRYSKRTGGWVEEHPVTFTKKDAITAKLWEKDDWQKNPRNHLFYRAISLAYRALAGDIFDTPVYATEELPPNVLNAEYVIKYPPPTNEEIAAVFSEFAPTDAARIVKEAQESGRLLSEVIDDFKRAQQQIQAHGKEVIVEANGGDVPQTIDELEIVVDKIESEVKNVL